MFTLEGEKSMAEATVSFVLFCFISICLCLYNTCDNPTSLADTPPNRLSYGEISNHCKQITTARRTWKINVLGGGSCMTIGGFERWELLSVWYGMCFPPVLLSLRSVPPLVSCPAGMLAKLIGLLQIRQRNCSRNISPFSLCSPSPGSLEGIEVLRTQHKSSLPSLLCIYLWFPPTPM